MSIRPNFISTDLTSYKDDIMEYAASGRGNATYKTGTDGVISGTSFTSASNTFVAANVGKYIALQGIGYALITTLVSDHVLALDTTFAAATAVRFCVDGHAGIERDAFAQIKTDAVYGWSRTIMDSNGLPRAVRVKGLLDMTGSTVEDYDFMDGVDDKATTFDEAHKLCTLWRICRKESVQGGNVWKDIAANYQLDYYGALQTAIDSLARSLVDSGAVCANQRNGDIIFARLERI
jgi:hypothetical protein